MLLIRRLIVIMLMTMPTLALAQVDDAIEQWIDELCNRIKSNHVERLQKGECTITVGFVLNDLLTDFERVSDHCSNVAVAMIELESDEFDTHEYLSKVKSRRDDEFEKKFEEYSSKYSI